jgi:hypothetical protein
MLKVDQSTLEGMETKFPGIVEDIQDFESTDLPSCPKCGTYDTAQVECGLIGRTINIITATTKMKLIPNGPKPGDFFCHPCGSFFS